MRAAIPENPPKTMVYDALATWNRDFDQVLEDLQRLEALRLFPRRWRREFLKVWQAALGEIRAWANFEVLEVLHQTEEEEWTNFARRRRRQARIRRRVKRAISGSGFQGVDPLAVLALGRGDGQAHVPANRSP